MLGLDLFGGFAFVGIFDGGCICGLRGVLVGGSLEVGGEILSIG